MKKEEKNRVVSFGDGLDFLKIFVIIYLVPTESEFWIWRLQ